jgi:hypothetical protein
VSQHDKANTIRFTLKAFSSVPFKMAPVADPYTRHKEVRVDTKWTPQNCGGSTNSPATHEKNPKWLIRVEKVGVLVLKRC